MSDVEKKILKIYDGSRPNEEDLFESAWINQLSWSLVVVLTGIVLWFGAALVNAENQRYALVTRQCQDRVFKEEVDLKCMEMVHSRPHWWQHLWYGATHISPEAAPAKSLLRPG